MSPLFYFCTDRNRARCDEIPPMEPHIFTGIGATIRGRPNDSRYKCLRCSSSTWVIVERTRWSDNANRLLVSLICWRITRMKYYAASINCYFWTVLLPPPYLDGMRFKTRTDHDSLMIILTLSDASGRLALCSLRFFEFSAEVDYSACVKHLSADALSRIGSHVDKWTDLDDNLFVWNVKNLQVMDEMISYVFGGRARLRPSWLWVKPTKTSSKRGRQV